MDGIFLLTAFLALLLVTPLMYYIAMAFWDKDHVPAPVDREMLPTACPTSPSNHDAPKPPGGLRDRLRSLIVDPPDQSVTPTRHYFLRPTLLHWYMILFLTYVTLSVASVGFRLKRHPKTAADWAEDVECILLRGITLLLVGVEQRLSDRAHRGLFITLTIYSVLMYSIVFQIAPKVSIKVEVLTIEMIICLAFAATVVGVILIHHLLFVCRQPGTYRLFYCGTLILIITLVGLGVSLFKMHVHHFWWGWVLAHFFNINTKASVAAQACCIALFIHGISMFGCDPLFPGMCGG